ncbi:MAG: prepilin-type N-terminal cleavage/methylation domain-containing protein [Gammaproteobacteria bacterium]|nr:prepilin-type N-terminal cleavage/methylation domain-containing protein [Gammaproteobacteria bacterium]
MSFANKNGLTLVEVLVSLILLTFIFIGTDVMQLISLRIAKHSFFIFVARQELMSIVDQAQICKLACSKSIQHWQNEVKLALPHGEGEVKGVYPNYIFTVKWGNPTESICKINHQKAQGCLQVSLK